MDYCYTHPDATIRFMASEMILALHSDASYLSEPGAKSRAGGHFYLKDYQYVQVQDENDKTRIKMCGHPQNVRSLRKKIGAIIEYGHVDEHMDKYLL